MYTFYMRKYAGVSDEGLSMWYMNETDDKGNPTGKRVTTTEYAKASDYLCGDPIPDLYGGFGTSVNFRGFDLSVAFTYQIGGLAYDSILRGDVLAGQQDDGYELAQGHPQCMVGGQCVVEHPAPAV